MRDGEVVQVGTSEEILTEPANKSNNSSFTLLANSFL
jgi:ABC-type proline/glycine betaine transport system ATPase subunit